MEQTVQNLALSHPAFATIMAVITATVTFASALANAFPKATKLGKVVHFLAGNWSAKTGV